MNIDSGGLSRSGRIPAVTFTPIEHNVTPTSPRSELPATSESAQRLRLYETVMDIISGIGNLDRGCEDVLQAVCLGHATARAGALWIASPTAHTAPLQFQSVWLAKNVDSINIACRWLTSSQAADILFQAYTNAHSQLCIAMDACNGTPSSDQYYGLAIALIARQRPLGAIVLVMQQATEPSPGLVHTLEHLGSQIGVCIAYHQTETQLRERLAMAEANQSPSFPLHYFHTALRHSAISLYTIDLDLHYTWTFNPAVENADRIIGKTDTDLLPAKQADAIMHLKRQVLESGMPVHSRAFFTIDGKDVFYDFTLDPMYDDHGRISGIISSATDITQRHRTQARLYENMAQLRENEMRQRELNELKTRFISMVSHEFRTPLSTILSSAELIEHYWDRLPDDKRRRYTAQIRSSSTEMADMLEDILLLGRYEAGKAPFNPQPMALQQFCSDLVEQVQTTVGTGCRLHFEGHGDCGSAVMDEKLLQQILTNLLSNAIKYSTQPETSVVLTLDCSDTLAVFRVVDQGIGIPAADQRHILDPFNRASNVGKISGTGLGLTIVQRAVQTHQGEISFTSEEGAGSTFTVTLPLRPPGL
jgi:PAS domain S-box-containing protein